MSEVAQTYQSPASGIPNLSMYNVLQWYVICQCSKLRFFESRLLATFTSKKVARDMILVAIKNKKRINVFHFSDAHRAILNERETADRFEKKKEQRTVVVNGLVVMSVAIAFTLLGGQPFALNIKEKKTLSKRRKENMQKIRKSIRNKE